MTYSSWAAVLASTVILSTSLPASAQAVRFDQALARGPAPLITDVQFREGGDLRRFRGNGGPRGGGFGGRGYAQRGGGYGRGWRGGRGAAIGAGVAGLAAGALIGGAIAAQSAPTYGYDNGYYAAPTYADPAYAGYPAYADDGGYGYAAQPVQTGDASGYCAQRYKSYDPGSGTYLGYDGLRHPCP